MKDILQVVKVRKMSVMSIRIDDNKRKTIKALASLEGKTISRVVEELIDTYIQDKKTLPEAYGIMKLSELSFMEWDNSEDEVYNDL